MCLLRDKKLRDAIKGPVTSKKSSIIKTGHKLHKKYGIKALNLRKIYDLIIGGFRTSARNSGISLFCKCL